LRKPKGLLAAQPNLVWCDEFIGEIDRRQTEDGKDSTMEGLRNHLTGWVLVGAVLASLPAYRAALQPDYEWGLFGVTGTGMSASYAVVLVAAIGPGSR
jgi:hypothetical protein